jgi:hypothetical protein
MQKRSGRAAVVVVTLILFFSTACLFSPPCANAELDVDEYFEISRGELLGFYSSEIVSHAALILGFFAAEAALWKDLRNDNKSSQRRDFLEKLSVCVLAGLILSCTCYSGLKLIYWSGLEAHAIEATPNEVTRVLDKNITSSNVTSWTSLLNEYNIRKLQNEPQIQYVLALWVASSWCNLVIFVVFVTLLVPCIFFAKEIRQQSKQFIPEY